jgi:uncharacterized protein YbaP (TraB family)
MRYITSKHLAAIVVAVFVILATTACNAEQQGLLYTISKDGQLRGYLLGTVHSDDPRVLNFSEKFIGALDSCDSFAMELVPNQPTLSRLMDYMHYADGTTLESRIGPERYAGVLEAASQYHLGPDQISTMKVWAAMMTLSIPPPENGLFMDLSLALRAAGNGLDVVGLETLDEQLAFLENMPMDQQLLLLDQALEEFESLHVFYDELIAAYLKKDLQALQDQSDDQFEQLPEEVGDYFFAEGIDARNKRMADRLNTQLESAKVFAAVGALHLPGEYGLVELMRAAGFEVKPAPFSPFAD